MKDLTLQIISGVILLIIGAVFPVGLGALTSSQKIIVSYNWIDLPARLTELGYNDKDQVIKNLAYFIGKEDAGTLFEKLQYKSSFRIITGDIDNNSDEQSKQVKIYNSKMVAVYYTKSKRYGDAMSRSIIEKGEFVDLGNVNPEQTLKFVIVSDETIIDPDLLVLEDTKKVGMRSVRLKDDIFGITYFTNEHPIASYIVASISMFVAAGFVIAIPFAVGHRYSLTFAARHTTADELVRWSRIIARARSIDPVKAAALDRADNSGV